MDCSMPGLPVHHQLLEFTQTRATFGSPLMQGWSPLESQLILVSVSYLIAHFVQAADFSFRSLYAGRSSKNKFKIFNIGKRRQDKNKFLCSRTSLGFCLPLSFDLIIPGNSLQRACLSALWWCFSKMLFLFYPVFLALFSWRVVPKN